MPELPEVETTKRGLMPLITNQIVVRVCLYRDNLRWEMPKHLVQTLANKKVLEVNRRGKYLLIEFEVGVLIIHLGMSGSIRVVNNDTALKKHEHFALVFDNNTAMRLNDPRRFGAVLFSKDGSHPLLNNLGVEPLSLEDEKNLFNDEYLYVRSRKKQQNIKAFIMDSKIVVGVGNIYACESLFVARIDPQHPANSVSKARYQALTQAIKHILTDAISAGGTTLQDFAQVDGAPGYFAQTLNVYGRENQPCSFCNGRITRFIQNQRSTFYCKQCQI